MAKLRRPVHPGEILVEDFMKPLGLSQNGLALALGIPAPRIHEIAHGRRAITADTALRLARYFGTSEQFWMGMQAGYDLEVARRALGEQLARIQLLPRPDLEYEASEPGRHAKS